MKKFSPIRTKPVCVEQLLSWEVAPPEVFLFLQEAVLNSKNILISGGSYTGKTTLLSALANFIPPEQRIVKIENTEEILMDHPHAISLKARPASLGTDVLGYRIEEGVNNALQLSPCCLIVGEIGKGEVALPLFRAMVDAQAGMSTIQAKSHTHAVHILSLMLFKSNKICFRQAKELFVNAVDLVVQLGWKNQKKRKLLGVWAVHKERLERGEVDFDPLWLCSH